MFLIILGLIILNGITGLFLLKEKKQNEYHSITNFILSVEITDLKSKLQNNIDNSPTDQL